MIADNIGMILPAIETSGLTLGEKVCVVAPGPNGKNHYHEIPHDFSIIAINKAVLIEGLNPDWWIIIHTDAGWFPAADEYFSGIRVYFDRHNNFPTEKALARSENKNYYFSAEKENLDEHVVHPVEGCIRVGATGSAMAVQMAYNFGAREILLCGVDMSGNMYWDNTANEDPGVHDHWDVWGCVKNFNPLLDYYRNKLKIKIATLSKTKLNLPFYY
jgi:hypothetical protein